MPQGIDERLTVALKVLHQLLHRGDFDEQRWRQQVQRKVLEAVKQGLSNAPAFLQEAVQMGLLDEGHVDAAMGAWLLLESPNLPEPPPVQTPAVATTPASASTSKAVVSQGTDNLQVADLPPSLSECDERKM